MTMEAVEWEACVLERRRDRELEEYVRRGFGTVPSSVPYFTPVPWIVRSMTSMSPLAAPRSHVPMALVEIASLVVSQDNSCRYCYGIQRLMLRVFGVPAERIHKLEQGLLDAEIDPFAKAGLDFARRLSRGAPLVGRDDAAALRGVGWEPAAIRELAFECAYSVFMNRLMTAAAIPYAPVENLADSWRLRWLAPFMRFDMKRRMRQALARSAPLTADEERGPFAYLVRGFAGLACARSLRETLDAAFESPVLSRRAKTLVFAVVARGLDCPQASAESTRLLVEAGLPAASHEPILQHLGSPELDPVESVLLPFARQTMRGRPQQIQQRTRGLLERLAPEQVVEAVGIAALANAVCRLGVVTQAG